MIATGFTPAEELAAVQGLSRQQRAVLDHICAGQTYERAAEELCLSTHTIKNHLTKVYARLRLIGVGSCAPAACRMVERADAYAKKERARVTNAHTIKSIHRPPAPEGAPSGFIVDPLMPLLARFVAAAERIAAALEAANEVNPLALLDAAMKQAEQEKAAGPWTAERLPAPPAPPAPPSIPTVNAAGLPESEAWRLK